MGDIRCRICGAKVHPHLCVTRQGMILCWECFREFLRRRKDAKA